MSKVAGILRKHKFVLFIFFLSLLIRFILLPGSRTVDADAVSRTYMGLHWLDNPHFITNGVWAPFHIYFNAFFLSLIPDNILAVKVEMILFAALTVFPLFFFTKKLFNEKAALFASLIYAFSPVVFRNSYHNLSGVIYAFFVMSALYYLFRALKETKIKDAVAAGIMMTIAAGIRYEAWLLMAVFFMTSLLYRKWKVSLVFAAISGIFPLFWMTGNYLEYRDPLYSVSAANYYNIVLEGINENLTSADKIKRILFFPASLFLVLTPFISFIYLLSLVRSFRKKLWNRDRMIWFTPFLVVFVIYMYKAYTGGLLLHHRYSVSLVLLLAPFIGFFFHGEKKSFAKKKSILLGSLVALMVPLSFVFSVIPWYKAFSSSPKLKTIGRELYLSFDQTEAVPRLHNPLLEEFGGRMNELHKGGGLVMDFIGWKESAYLSLKVLQHRYIPVHFVNGNVNGTIDYESIRGYFDQFHTGTLVLRDDSRFEKQFVYDGKLARIRKINGLTLELDKLGRKGDMKVFRYSVAGETQATAFDPDSDKEPVNQTVKDIGYYEARIYRDRSWLEDIRVQARRDGVSLEKKVEDNARYMVEHN